MSDNWRIEIDKFQMLTQELSDTICLYFERANPSTVINLVQACNNLTKDIAEYYARKGFIEALEFWSDQTLFEDPEDRKIFRQAGNFVKHSDENTSIRTSLINNQLVSAYLLAAVLDFVKLRDVMLNAKLVSRTSAQDYNGGKPPTRNLLLLLGRNKDIAEFLYNRRPRVDVLSSLYVDWYACVSPHKSEILNEMPLCHKISFPIKAAVAIEHFRSTASDPCVRAEFARYSVRSLVAKEIKVRGCGFGKVVRSHYYTPSVKIDGEMKEETVPNEMIETILESDFF